MDSDGGVKMVVRTPHFEQGRGFSPLVTLEKATWSNMTSSVGNWRMTFPLNKVPDEASMFLSLEETSLLLGLMAATTLSRNE